MLIDLFGAVKLFLTWDISMYRTNATIKVFVKKSYDFKQNALIQMHIQWLILIFKWYIIKT